jgi:hypothetical protein
MGIEFRLGRQDHKKVEDFLATEPPNVDAIWVEAGNVTLQAAVIEQAIAKGVRVLVDPMTERLTDEGYSPATIPYAKDGPLDLGRLARSAAHRGRLIEAVLDLQDPGSHFTPPHFYVADTASAELNVALIAGTIEEAKGYDVRAILLAGRKYLAEAGVAANLAQRYADVGVTSLDLRLTPLGTDDDGARKIRTAYDIMAAFRREGISVTLGSQGLLGQTALALGIVDGFSTGIGMRQSINHGSAMAVQRKPKDDSAEFFAPQPGIWLPGAEVTVLRRVAALLLDDRSIRSRLACHIDSCATEITGPLKDPRTHYLHSRCSEVAALLSRPAPWRAAQEETRLRRAIEMRNIVNTHLPEMIGEVKVYPIKTRTLEVLVAELEERQQAA